MASAVTLTASAQHGYGGAQFVARIVGRSAKYTFRREFLGGRGGAGRRGPAENTAALIDEPGLYQTRDVSKEGNADSYWLIRLDGDQLVVSPVDRAKAMQLAKDVYARERERGRIRQAIAVLQQELDRLDEKE